MGFTPWAICRPEDLTGGGVAGVTSSEKLKMLAKEHLLASDQYLKKNLFDKARQEIEKAKQVDPANAYIPAFEERSRLFEEAYAKQHREKNIANALQPQASIPAKPQVQQAPQPKPVAVQDPAASPTPEPSQSTLKEELLTSTIVEMRQQLDELTKALKLERMAREEIANQQLETAVRQLRAALEKAWQFGAPKANEKEEIKRLVQILNVPPEVETSITREVKLMMYGKAVKEVISKRKLLRSSSSTLEWLRKIYQISISEYLEYESHFLMELVTSQFRGTMLFVSPDEKLRGDLVPRFKETGFAVASACSAEEALEKVERLSPVVILCDTMSEKGGLSGFKFLHFWRTRSRNETVPFILLCEPFEEEQIRASELKGAEGFITKTTEFDQIHTLVNEKLQHIREYIGSIA
jgi:CheY-like chemotaxis protein